MMPETNKIICGAMPEATKVFPDGYFNCSISSPPYWALRDYGVDGQLGLEPTFEEYIDKLCTIYDEVKRVLRKDGTCWVNLGDTYGNSGKGISGGYSNKSTFKSTLQGYTGERTKGRQMAKENWHFEKRPGIKDQYLAKSLCLIPQRFAIEMVNRGWILRNVIIWHKPNPMPSSAKDRFTVDFEYVYFFVKSKNYWFEPQYEPHKDWKPSKPINPTAIGTTMESGFTSKKDGFNKYLAEHGVTKNPLGRNKRTVWTIPTQAFPDCHFATFPEKLVAPMIKAGCPEFVCTKCGKAREKIYKATGGSLGKSWHPHKADGQEGQSPARLDDGYKIDFKGYTDCGCNADWRPGIVLDCFCRVRDYFTGSRQTAA